ncbi:MAG: YkgJ family cysteine cluster protein [Bdellovibrionaceae bacterium]|nr:YkgJ family cysteine cluster protein [Pseudobdellovibrionaceae bacterium]
MEVLETQFVHPCLSCGACCASFRVAFYWREAEPAEHEAAVPQNFWEELTERHRCMKGTSSKHQPKCVALEGRIGNQVQCSIYSQRPSTCRDFEASYENGEKNEKCDRARIKHGMQALVRGDWSGR